ncbi:HAD family hydrolase [Mesomycoplasma hyopneumoniae]|uniref:Hydrolase of the HAD family n=4 Tax=Mesomycoplasma hyopneumoniae TaxID=2099 RepID=E4QSL1_MESH1|nr:Cof-type HAD-IIB family hydrolase [Mesomycoplasma hyopneumoniae]AAZ44295.1 putative hydrolase of the HAD family [Mesomycoplasma hyopneumoniae J]ADQ90420.2 Hydrolase of the HAD family [Mesomycoplasma hyopneumoniae 168]AGM21988.1 Hydrolase of the HAD family [Mesomycoplasma hyopneumoniae 168-L]MXR10723.1 Cof-type HAD-IIB family hydrolase [Mesomycoplasma hyopneumoniae]MXR12954.1 Cof-type HAD-IIB family hydrolase [Mesomycoplasma hyopneumoniae]
MKLFFAFDLDGTLLRYDNTIHPENVEILKKLYELGHFLALATGRGLSGCLDLAKKYPYFHYLVSNNGTLVHDTKTQKTINNGSLSKEIIFDLIKDCKATDSICAFSSPNNLFEFSSTNNHPWLKKQKIMDLHFYEKVDQDKLYEIIEKEEITQVAFRNDIPVIAELYKKWSKKLKNIYKVTITNRIFLDINPLNVDKANGIKMLLEKNNLKPDQLIAFGDSSNDYFMVKLARFGYAMEDSTPDLLSVAYQKIGNCNSGSIAKTIKSLLEKQEELFS